ncbi:23S rRNA pseudouridine2605 synthase [Roseibium hamelinense]|uniref:Pseudouridine synthase n=1 Tax=Roseibium hamelinense TaxID=150831 RepID=A0A562T2F6_9HYPH|nr:rRNA pseudouridine synthase [Roseibium hamelinense]TWI87593.1 23S rRNA pseudouridine2605 synthase [Roseibium hamelinense]
MTTDKKTDRRGPKRSARPNAQGKKPVRGKPGPKKAVPGQSSEARPTVVGEGERIAKVMARAGLCSRREAETWIAAGRVELNGKILETPAVTVSERDTVSVDGAPLPMRERTRLWLYHKPRGLVTTNKDPEGRPTVFEKLPADLPRVLTVGRLDINTEGLLLLTNDGGLARALELPATGWLRRYRVRAFGKVTQEQLDGLADGVAIEGVLYGAIEATLDKAQGDNVWLTVGLREGKNREVKRVLEHLGLTVNRLIRLSFGPFQLLDLNDGEVREIRGRVLRDQLGEKLIEQAGADFDAPIMNERVPEQPKKTKGPAKGPARGAGGKKQGSTEGRWLSAREAKDSARPRKSNRPTAEKHGDKSSFEPRPSRSQRRIWGEDGLIEDKRQEGRNERQDRSGPEQRDKSRPKPRGGRR